MLLSLASRIRIVNHDHLKRPVRCVCDGRAVEGVTEVHISHQGGRIELLRGPGYDFIETVVRKIIGKRPESSEEYGDS
jgi:NAD kinase